MSQRLLATAFVLLLFAAPAVAQIQGISKFSPPNVVEVAISPRDSDLIVLGYGDYLPGSTRSLTRSLDGGATFEPLSVAGTAMASNPIEAFAFSRAGTLFAAADGTLYRSRDRGTTFDAVLDFPAGEIKFVSIDPHNASHLWVTASETFFGYRAHRSRDGGDTWQVMPDVPGHTNELPERILFDPVVPNRVLRVFFGYLVVTDGTGSTVVSREDYGVQNNVRWSYVGGRILRRRFGPGTFQASENGGGSWFTIPAPAVRGSEIAYNPLAPNQLAFIAEGMRCVSNDGGLSWQTTGAGAYDGDPYRARPAFVPAGQGAYSAQSQGLVIGRAGGGTIARADEDHLVGPSLPSGAIPLYFAEIDQQDPTLWIDKSRDEFRNDFRAVSRDRGESWTSYAMPRDGDIASFRVQPSGVVQIYTESPSGWIEIQPDGSFQSGTSLPRPGMDPVEIGVLDGALRVTTDAGLHWQVVDTVPVNGLENYIRGALRTTPTGVQIVRASYEFGLWTDVVSELSWTADFGQSWHALPDSGNLESCTWNDVHPEVMYACNHLPNLPTQRSDDGGQTWSNVGDPGLHGIILRGNLDPDLVLRSVTEDVLPRNSYRALEAIDYELSRDGGQTWVSLGVHGFPGYDGLFQGRFIAPDDSYILLGSMLFDLASDIGTPECMANPNVTGLPARIAAIGSTSVAAGDVLLRCSDLPPFTFGLFTTSRTAAFVPNVGGSAGNLCLGGSIGRIAPMPLRASSTGVISLRLDTARMPQGSQLVPILPGDTWRYSLWFRDGATSNRANAVAIEFTQ